MLPHATNQRGVSLIIPNAPPSTGQPTPFPVTHPTQTSSHTSEPARFLGNTGENAVKSARGPTKSQRSKYHSGGVLTEIGQATGEDRPDGATPLHVCNDE